MKKMYLLKGGPYNGKQVPLSSPGTPPFRVGVWKGYYNGNNTWVSLA